MKPHPTNLVREILVKREAHRTVNITIIDRPEDGEPQLVYHCKQSSFYWSLLHLLSVWRALYLDSAYPLDAITGDKRHD